MVYMVALIFVAIPLLYALNIYRAYARNLAAAKASGLPYIPVPFYMVSRFWLITQTLWVPYIRILPVAWTEPWLELVLENWAWTHQYTFFKKFGTDTFITVSPGGNLLSTADASVITQITSRRNDFPKPLRMYQSLSIYGGNVISSEGQLWKKHRKVTSPPFSEKNNHIVWAESLNQAQVMMRIWMDGKENSSTINSVAEDVMRLSLHVISLAGFGKRLSRPGVEGDKQEHSSRSKIGEGHTLTYTDALTSLLENMILILLTPKFLLKNLPLKTTKSAYQAYIEWGKYLNEIFQAKRAELASGKEQKWTDLMGALVSAGTSSEPSADPSEKETNHQPAKQVLTDAEIMGNAFVFMVAGHETTGNSIHFSLILLALHPPSQRRLQNDLDTIFQGRPVSEWDYDQDIPKLFGGMCGAVLNEELRLIPPVVTIPKCTPPTSAQDIVIQGKSYTVPADTYVNIMTASVHRNPNFWPHGPPTDPKNPLHPTSNTDNDLEEFKPERWLLSPQSPPPTSGTSVPITTPSEPRGTTDSEPALTAAPDTSALLYRPPKGAYIPFSDGHRACLGRRFGQVEVLAVLAVIFSQYSVELAVDVSDEQLEAMSETERREVWERKRGEVRRLMREGMGSIITIQFRGGRVPLRFVKRGKERFWW